DLIRRSALSSIPSSTAYLLHLTNGTQWCLPGPRRNNHRTKGRTFGLALEATWYGPGDPSTIRKGASHEAQRDSQPEVESSRQAPAKPACVAARVACAGNLGGPHRPVNVAGPRQPGAGARQPVGDHQPVG